MQSNYKNNTLPFADISAKYQTEMDKVDITSKETIQVETVNKSDYSDEEISEFLKDKPYTAFSYNYYNKYAKEQQAKEYIYSIMDTYYNSIDVYDNPIERRREMDLYAYKNDITEDDIYNILGNETALNIGQLLGYICKWQCIIFIITLQYLCISVIIIYLYNNLLNKKWNIFLVYSDYILILANSLPNVII